jgi:uncharacterized protein
VTALRVFVTGASGFVGRHLCQALRDNGLEVYALVRREDPWLERIGVRCWIGSLGQLPSWTEAVAGADYVIHCAGNAVFGNGNHYYKENVDWTAELIQEVKRVAPDVRRFVFVSTIGAVDRASDDLCCEPLTDQSVPSPTSDYGRSKLEAEALVRQSGLPYCIVRPAMVVGADMRANSHFAVFARHAIKRSPIGRFALPGRFSVVHVEDLADALWLCAIHPDANGMTLFCAGEPVELGEFFAYCENNYARIPLGWVRGLVRRFRRVVPFWLKAITLPALVASDEGLRRLGWRPRYSGMQVLESVIVRERERLNPMEILRGQTVVTGAASGLGRAVVARLSAIRPRLLLVDRNLEGLEEVVKQHPQSRILLEDLGSEQGIKNVLLSREWNEYPVAELFACAGIGIRGRIADEAIDGQLGMFHVNVLARLRLAHAAVQEMVRRQFGRVVLISSSSAFQPLPYMATYAASNAAVLFLGEAWSEELKSSGVEMITACPGGMDTNFQEAAGVRKNRDERLLDPHFVATAIFDALGSGKASMIISVRARLMSCLARMLPRSLSLKIWGRLMEKMR